MQAASHQPSYNTELKNRTLWYDGTVTMTPKQVVDYLLTGKSLNTHIYISDIDEDVKKYNVLEPDNKLLVKENIKDFNADWNIPEKYKNLDIKKYIHAKLYEECEKLTLSDEDVNIRIARVKQELQIYSKYNLYNIVKALIYIVDKLEENKVIWGTGRGSSCSSYLLYLIKLHDVDSVKYELDIKEFIR